METQYVAPGNQTKKEYHISQLKELREKAQASLVQVTTQKVMLEGVVVALSQAIDEAEKEAS